MIEVHLERDIHELDFEYNAKMEGYTNLTSDILKLGEMRLSNSKNVHKDRCIHNRQLEELR